MTISMRRFILLLTNLLFIPLAAPGVIINGSDILGNLLEEPIREFAGDQGIPIALELDGSISALEGLKNQDAHIALYTNPEGTPPEGAYSAVPIAFQVVALAVHQSNPVETLDYEQISAMFGANGRIEEWGMVTEDPGKINLGAIRSNRHLAMDLFRYKILEDQALKSTVTFYDNADELVGNVRNDNSSLVILPAAVPYRDIKYVPVSRDPQSQAYLPSMDNVHFGDYPLRLPF